MEQILERMPLENELQALFEADQKDRLEELGKSDPESYGKREEQRYARAKEMLARKDELGADSLYHLAMLFQHGRDAADYKTAWELAERSATLGSAQGLWLSAAAEDRYLLTIGEKQKWGTQFRRDSAQDEWEQSPMASDEESGITGEMRQTRHVPIRADQLTEIRKKYER